jgi:23S rRNA (guanosine2251-2'-O)-methyltransferase
VHVVVAPKDKAVGITETVRRVSVGAADHVPFAQVTNLARTMEKLKTAGLWLVGTSNTSVPGFISYTLPTGQGKIFVRLSVTPVTP